MSTGWLVFICVIFASAIIIMLPDIIRKIKLLPSKSEGRFGRMYLDYEYDDCQWYHDAFKD